MKTLVKPYWIFILVIIPQILLIVVFSSSLAIIKSELTSENLNQILTFAAVLISGMAAFSIISYVNILRGKVLHPFWIGLALLMFYIAFLFFYFSSDNLIPANIPQWMISWDDLFKYVITCIIPSIIYGIVLLVIHFTPEENPPKLWKSFLSMIGIPTLWYVFYVVLFPMLNSGFNYEYILSVVLTISTLGFIFYLIRIAYILTINKNSALSKYQLPFKILFAIALPIGGLIFNSNNPFQQNIFGDFSHWIFYLLAVLNGILICFQVKDNGRLGLFLFILKSVTFSFTFYFFIVFLPFLPLSIVAVILAGLGFLMLTPTILFIIHLQELYKDVQKLKGRYNNLTVILISSFLVIPLLITAYYLNDRRNLHMAMEYAYEPDLNKPVEIEISSITSVLKHVHQNKEENRIFLRHQTPYLSSFYNWVVLDNLTLSDEKLQFLEMLFHGKSDTRVVRNAEPVKKDLVKINNIKTTTKYDSVNDYWNTWVDLEIKNERDTQEEYFTKIHLPQGCYVNNYYLFVNGKKKFGLLAERKSALWVYSQIKNVRKDPGILYYSGANDIVFRVFPFNAGEVRYTGINFVHKETIEIEIDGNKIALGNKFKSSSVLDRQKDIFYLTKDEKAKLPKIYRKPYYHFIVDCASPSQDTAKTLEASVTSAQENVNKSEKKKIVINRITEYLKKHPLETDAIISFTDHKTYTYSVKEDWQKKFQKIKFQGGFFLERTIKKELVDNYLSKSGRYPVFVVITEDLKNSLNTNSLKEIPYTYPETDLFYHLKPDNTLDAHSFTSKFGFHPIKNVEKFEKKEVYLLDEKSNGKFYFPINNVGEIVVKDFEELSENFVGKSLIDKAMHLQALSMKMSMKANKTELLWHPILKESFTSKIMTPSTSYIVLETEAQEKALLAKQKQVMAAKKSLDVTEQEIEMTEPELWLLLIFLFAFVAWRKRNEIKQKFI